MSVRLCGREHGVVMERAEAVAWRPRVTSAPLILVVDDEDPLLGLFRLVLEENGYDVVTARDGHDALAVAEEAQPALIISDVMMPNLDGNGLCQRLRDHPKTRHIPVILMSAAIPRSRVDPAVYFLPKPFELENLEEVVAQALQGQRNAV